MYYLGLKVSLPLVSTLFGESYYKNDSYTYKDAQLLNLDECLILLAIKTITSIRQHAISATVKEFQGKPKAKNQIKKLKLSIGSNDKLQIIQEIIQSNGKIQCKIQQPLQYLAEFKKGVYQMREEMSRAIIDRHCLGLMKIFALDIFVENKLRGLHKENSIRFAGIIEVFIYNGMYKGESKNGICKF